MNRQNLFSDAWDGENGEAGTRQRIFWRPDDARMGATLYELTPDAPETRIHMHFGAEEMFFVLSGRPVFRNQHGKEELAPGHFVFCPEGRAGLHTVRATPPRHPLRSSRSVPGASRTSSPTPNTDMHGWRLASRSRSTCERRRPRHHRSLRDPDRVIARPYRPKPEPKRPRERPLRVPGSGCIRGDRNETRPLRA